MKNNCACNGLLCDGICKDTHRVKNNKDCRAAYDHKEDQRRKLGRRKRDD